VAPGLSAGDAQHFQPAQLREPGGLRRVHQLLPPEPPGGHSVFAPLKIADNINSVSGWCNDANQMLALKEDGSLYVLSFAPSIAVPPVVLLFVL